MTMTELYSNILERFLALPGVPDLLKEPITVTKDAQPEVTLMPKGDVPSAVKRPEYRVTALFRGTAGEAYTEKPEDFSGTLEEVLHLPVTDQGISACTVASINAVMNALGLCPGTFPEDPEMHFGYAADLYVHVSGRYGKSNIVLVGYDGYIVKKFMDEGMDFWTMDRDPDNITKDRFHHIVVNSARYNREASFAWAKLFIITGSTFCNGTVLQYLDKGTDLLFYGITGSGICTLLDLPRF